LFAATSMSFSSYAGYMSSLDDFYLMNSGLVMIQTSLSVLDKKRLAMQEKNGLLAWHRVRNANAIAKTGPEWAELLGYQNSGTYNNEYMVLNLNKFRDFESATSENGSDGRHPEPEPLKDELLYLVEQIPRLVAHGDVTPILRYGYFPSYNEPYFKEVYAAAGYAAYVNKTHDFEETHSLAPRATIFRRDQHEADSHEGVMKILRSNNYKVDPLSKGSPRKAVCSRGDLDSLFVAPTDVKGLRSGEYKSSVSYVFGDMTRKEDKKVGAELEQRDHATAKYLKDVMQSVKVPSGCYDTKISSTKWTKDGLQAQVVSGPTRGTGLPVFEWSAFPDLPHQGLPPKYDFAPVHMKPKLVDPLVFGAEYFKRREGQDSAEIAFDATLKELISEQEETMLAEADNAANMAAEEPVVIA